MKRSKSMSFIREFNKNPDERNWKTFSKKLVKDRAKYYYVVYPDGPKSKSRIREAYAVIYDARYRQLYRIPIIRITSKGTENAMAYLKNLDVNRKMIEELESGGVKADAKGKKIQEHMKEKLRALGYI